MSGSYGKELRDFLSEKEKSTDHWGDKLYELAYNLDGLDNEPLMTVLVNKFICEVKVLKELQEIGGMS